MTDQGLVAKDGTILYSSQRYTEKIEALRLAQKHQEQERQRIVEVVKKSKEKTTIIEKFELIPTGYSSSGHNISPNRVTISDVSVELEFPIRGNERTREVGYFANIDFIRQVGGCTPRGFYIGFSRQEDRSGAGFCLYAKTNVDAQTIKDTLLKEFNKWSLKYPEAIPKNILIEK
jgi:hypothetical protein